MWKFTKYFWQTDGSQVAQKDINLLNDPFNLHNVCWHFNGMQWICITVVHYFRSHLKSFYEINIVKSIPKKKILLKYFGFPSLVIYLNQKSTTYRYIHYFLKSITATQLYTPLISFYWSTTHLSRLT